MRKVVFIAIALILVIAILGGCSSAPSTNSGSAGKTELDAEFEAYYEKLPKEPVPDGLPLKHPDNDVYVWVCPLNSLPLFVNNDYVGLDLAAKELGVTVKKTGPQEWDIPATVAALEQQIALKPAGVIVPGFDPTLNVPVNKLIEAGIPVVCTDADLPNSKRLAFIGGSWYDQGVEQAKAMAPYLEGKTGKVATIGLQGTDDTYEAKQGFVDTMAVLNPNIEVTGIYDSKADSMTVTRVATDLIQGTPDLLGLAGFDNICGPSIATAIRETGKKGQIYATSCDVEPEQLQTVKEGYIIATVGAKAKLQTYYAVKLLYDYNHSPLRWTDDDITNGVTNIPEYVYIGFITVTPENVDVFIAANSTTK